MSGTSSSSCTVVEAFSPVVSRTNGASMTMKNKAAASSALRMSAADDEVAKLRAAAQKAREEAQALAKVSSLCICYGMYCSLAFRVHSSNK